MKTKTMRMCSNSPPFQIILFSMLFIFINSIPAYSGSEYQDACQGIFVVLDSVPHEKLIRTAGKHQSLWDKKTYKGCEVKFVTNALLLSGKSAPNLEALEGTNMYSEGWRMDNSIGADGPGTGIFSIKKGLALCLVRHDQPAYLDDLGEIVQSDTLSITVQCRQD